MLVAEVGAQCSPGGAVVLDFNRVQTFNAAACKTITATSFTLHPTLTSAQLQLPWTQTVSGILTLSDNQLLTHLNGLKNLTTVTGIFTIKVG